MRILTTILVLIWTSNLLAQETPQITIGGYADAYYSWYSNGDRTILQESDCIGAYHNNFGLNVAQVTSSIGSDRVRGTATLHFGDIPRITWANNYRNIQEANAGVRILEGLWLDVGFFKTHVGTESFLPKDNYLSIITLGTFYGPFYQSGARLSYDKDDWHFEAHAINSYNLHIDNNPYKTFGALISRSFGENVYFSYSNMLGQERIGNTSLDNYLVYQNIFTNLTFNKLDLQVGLDVANSYDWRVKNDWEDDWLVAALATARYRWDEKWSTTVRFELFSDQSMINSFQTRYFANIPSFPRTNDGMTVYGVTGGVAYAPSDMGFLRLECRYMNDPNFDPNYEIQPTAQFRNTVNPMLEQRAQVLVTVGFYFDKTFKFAE